MNKKKFVSVLLSAICGITMMPLTSSSAATVLTENATGNEDGYDYELWKDSGTTMMTLTGNGTFSCSWSDINNALFRTGKKYGCTQTYKEMDPIYVEYEVDYNPSGNSYLCLYGWTRSPLIEYYIVESWGSWRPPGATAIDTITVDGGVYDVYKTQRVEQPSIDGVTTFYQYWSVRQEKRTSGTISVSDHFAAWESLGLEAGLLYEAALTVEGYQSSGNATVLKNNFVSGPGSESETPSEPSLDENGYFFHSTYESGLDGWASRGSASIEATSAAANVGSQSLAVTGRTDAWNGTARTLGTSTFVPGTAYSFSTMVMQDVTSSESFKLSLQYNDASGEAKYATVAEATGGNGQWVQLSNTSFTIPSGASNLLLYVETADSTNSFYVDEAIGAPEGTKVTPNLTFAKGDVDGSGAVDADDVHTLMDYLLRREALTDGETADLNDDGAVNVLDLALLKAKVLVIEPVDPEETIPDEKIEGQWYNTADISWIDTSKPMVALTFDDGPVGTADTATSIRIQNALAQNGAHATFFYWGNRITSANEAEIVRAHELGFEVANHTYSHPNLTELTADEIKYEIYQTAGILNRLTGRTDFLVRPPYLAVNSTLQENCGAPLISCAIDSADWDGASAQDMISKITSKMQDGSLDNSIVLMHETYTSTAEAVEYLVPYLKQNGWQVVTVSELFKANGQTMYDGTVYTRAN